MADMTLTNGIPYRSLDLVGYRPRPMHGRPDGGEVTATQRCRRARAARRHREMTRKARMRGSLARAVAVLVLASLVGALAFAVFSIGQHADAEGVVRDARLDVPEDAVTDSLVVAPTDAASVTEGTVGGDGWAGWAVPDISDECPIVWQMSDDGSFVSNNGATIGSGHLFGADVSEHDGEIDWEAAKEGGLDFAIIRCGFGTDSADWDDECWERNVSECERLDIPYGVYLYSYVTDPDAAVLEAQHTIRLVSGHPCPLGIWYDIEEPTQAEALGYDSAAFGRLVRNYAATVEGATGAKVGVYTSRSWLETHMSEVAEDPGIPVWCACWTDAAPVGCDYECWQAGAAIVPGFDHACDFDVIFR